MKNFKKTFKAIFLLALGLFLLVVINSTIGYYSELNAIETSLTELQEAIDSYDFEEADSMSIDLKWIAGRVENGEERFNELSQQLISAKFKKQVDELLSIIDKNDIGLAESEYSKLLVESVTNKELNEANKDYLSAANSKLIATKDSLMKPYIERAKEALLEMHKIEDEFNNMIWFRDKTSSRYLDENAFFLLFAEEKREYYNKVYPLALRVQYYGDDWVFHEKFQLLIDGEVHTFRPDKVDRDNGKGGYVWEWSTQPLEDYISFDYASKRLVEVINSKETKIKFIGDKYYRIKTITKKQKEALRNVFLAYIAKGEYFKFANELF